MQKKLRYLFIVQGEGRGHMTQAIALKETLENAGHHVVCTLVGKSDRRTIPGFFLQKIGTPVFAFESPNFILDKENKRIRISRTILHNLIQCKRFYNNLKFIHAQVECYNPDVIINFYDFLAGIYNSIFSHKARFVCIGHQYLALHPEFVFPKGSIVDRSLLKLNTRITSIQADKRLALSFTPLPLHKRNNTHVLPPLLRKEILSVIPDREPFYLIYVVNEGYANEIIRWHQANNQVRLHCFWDKKEASEITVFHENLIFHKINDQKFLELMRSCSGYVSTAGFESICEAMYLDKPVMMVPIQGHYEQRCNALDAERARAGISNTSFDLSAFLNYLPFHTEKNIAFRNWVSQANECFITELACF